MKRPSLSRIASALAAVPAIVLLGGCVAAGDIRPYPAMAPVVPVVAATAPATPGAIYQAGPGLRLYSDRTARDVGDLLTITLVESTVAQTSASTQVANQALAAVVFETSNDTGTKEHRNDPRFDRHQITNNDKGLQAMVLLTCPQAAHVATP